MKFNVYISLVFICLVAGNPAPVMAEDWRQFRGPSGQGISIASEVPVNWGRQTNVDWKRDVPGTAWSSPVVSDGKIYLTTAVVKGEPNVTKEAKFSRKLDNEFSLRTLCLRADTGDILWDVEVATVPPNASIHPKNSHASATPIVTEDRVFVHFGIYGTAALDLSGEIVWKKEIVFSPVHGGGGSPVLFNDQLIFHCDGGDQAFVISLDAKTGSERWRTERSLEARRSFSFATPVVIEVDGDDGDAEALLVSPASDAVYAYDPNTGKEKWRVSYGDKWSVVPKPVFADGLILVCSGYEGPAELIAIRPGGSGDVSESHVAWRENKFVPYNPSPIVHEGKVFLVSDSGIASCRDLQTGELIWKERLGGNYSASPFIVDDKIYVIAEDGKCTVIEAADEYRRVAENDMEERTLASMVPVDGGVLVRTETTLFRIEQ